MTILPSSILINESTALVLVQSENTPKALANFSPGFEEREPWVSKSIFRYKPCKGLSIGEPFQGSIVPVNRNPGFEE